MTDISGLAALRVMCGLFLLPHLAWDLRNPKEGAKIYDVAGLGFSNILFPLSVFTEAALSLCLIVGILSRWTAFGAVFYLGVAAAVMWKVERRWLWNFKGIEFLVFWAACCVLVAVWGGK